MIRPALAFFLAVFPLQAAAARLVIVKADGVPGALLEEVRGERDPATGKSQLPWIDEVFGRQGTRIANFYVRGISLSTPSWSLLDTGLPQRIHGNVEYDRLTLRPYDYLNVVPFFFDYAFSHRADMPGVEVLDETGTPLLIDRFAPEARFQSFQLYQRGVRWGILEKALPYHAKLRGPRRLLEDSQTGLEMSSSLGERTIRDLIANLNKPGMHYLDFFTGDYDHTAHLTNDRRTQIQVLKRIDRAIGELWTAIQRTPQARSTILVLVSDHGMNTLPGVISQGFSLVDWLGSAAGGGHHVITDRYPLSEYKLHGLNPFVSEVTTPSTASPYLKDEAQNYPTALLDVDGNERAAIQLRNNDLGCLHMLLVAMAREDPKDAKSQALKAQFFAILERRRAQWTRTIGELGEEMQALDHEIKRQRAALKAMPKHFTAEDRIYGRALEPRRLEAHLRAWEHEEHGYGDYIQTLKALLALRADGFDAKKVDIGKVIPKRSLGELNTIYDLQNYSIGPSPEQTIDYPRALKNIVVRNIVQKELGASPVDFIIIPVPPGTPGLPGGEHASDAVWLYGGEERQALVIRCSAERGSAEIRYVPVRNLKGERDGSIHFEEARWADGFPLQLWEDPQLDTGGRGREEWLGGWHSEEDWRRAVYRTKYSEGVIGVLEEFLTPKPRPAMWDKDVSPADERILLRLEERRRRMVLPDMELLANDHWNFNTRGFNPGGNHGSFFQRSAHATFLIAGGDDTGVPKGLVVTEPYDSLSFAPTLLRLMGIEPKPGDPVMPGPVVRELFAVPNLMESSPQ